MGYIHLSTVRRVCLALVIKTKWYSMRILRLAKHFWIYLGRFGLSETAKYSWYWVKEMSYELWFQSNTSPSGGVVGELRITPESGEYQPVSFSGLHRALKTVPPDCPDEVFLDYGCGKGRGLLIAALFPYKRVLGVELDPALCIIAKENVERARKRFCCNDVEVFEEDATRFEIPKNVSRMFFYQPFIGQTMQRVIQNLEDSLNAWPRRFVVITCYPREDLDPFVDHSKFSCDFSFKPNGSSNEIIRIQSFDN